MKTFSAKPAEVEKKWVVIDGTGLVVGRLATIVAMRLRGKHKATYTPHVDDGDNVIIVNAEKVVLTGRKLKTRSIIITPASSAASRNAPRASSSRAAFPSGWSRRRCERMLPRGPLGRRQFGNLRVYKGPEHPHAAQNPEPLDVAAMNRKNVRSA